VGLTTSIRVLYQYQYVEVAHPSNTHCFMGPQEATVHDAVMDVAGIGDSLMVIMDDELVTISAYVRSYDVYSMYVAHAIMDVAV